jgi:hypothetical protein
MPTVSFYGVGADSQELVPAPSVGFIRVLGVSATGNGSELCTLTLRSGASNIKWLLYNTVDVESNISVVAGKEPIFDCDAGQELRLVSEGDGQFSVTVQYVLQ